MKLIDWFLIFPLISYVVLEKSQCFCGPGFFHQFPLAPTKRKKKKKKNPKRMLGVYLINGD